MTRILRDSISSRQNDLKRLRVEHDNTKHRLKNSMTWMMMDDDLDTKNRLKNSMTWMKFHLIIFSINCLQSRQNTVIEQRHEKKFDGLYIHKQIREGIQQNQNSLITNLSGIKLNDDEISFLKLGLKQGLLIVHSHQNLSCLKSGIDGKCLKIIRKLCKRCMILKPDKGQGIVLINKEDYCNSLNQLFSDRPNSNHYKMTRP